jgi:hypothetical protein
MARSPPRSPLGSASSPGSPTGKLVRSRKHNEVLQAEIHHLRDAFEDIDGRNQALREEKEQVVRRLEEVQTKLHRETEGLYQQSAYSKSLTQQLQVCKIPLVMCLRAFCFAWWCVQVASTARTPQLTQSWAHRRSSKR